MGAQKIKCLVWDLDNTLWQGILSEDREVLLREGVAEIVKTLDERGILQSIASRNNHDMAMAKLKQFGLDEFFLFPQIGWDSKSIAVENIRSLINISRESMAFIDDQPFEREEVNFQHPEVLCIDAIEMDSLLGMAEFNPLYMTEDSKNRRQLYRNDIIRNRIEEKFAGSNEEFLSSLGLKLTVAAVREDDLKRAEELTVRTHQLNATGYTYSYEELDQFRLSPQHLLFMSDLEDKYGAYGKIGLTLLEMDGKVWTLKLLLMSCRVMSRGIGSVLLNYVAALAKDAGVTLRAEFVPTEYNRMMKFTYLFAGFKELERYGNLIILEHDKAQFQNPPAYMELIVESPF